MQSEPAPIQLLQAARSWLLDELMPQVAQDKRYDALLIASAMAIVARELEACGAALEEDSRGNIERLRGFFPDDPEEQGRAGERLRALNARLARDIRAGRFDRAGAEREALRRFLRDDTVETLKQCNPKYLELEKSA